MPVANLTVGFAFAFCGRLFCIGGGHPGLGAGLNSVVLQTDIAHHWRGKPLQRHPTAQLASGRLLGTYRRTTRLSRLAVHVRTKTHLSGKRVNH
jgi:hypothetical protein